MAASLNKAGRRGFRPALAHTLASVTLLPVLLALGQWQLERAAEKEALFAADAAVQRASPQPVERLDASPLPQHARATGRYDNHLFLLDNRVHDGRVGFELLAPLRLADGRAVLVNLGWQPLGTSRKALPEVSVPDGELTMTALALTPEPPQYALSDREAFAAGWPKVVQTAVPQRLAQRLDYPLLPVLLYPDGSAAAALELKARHGFGPVRHRAYALQWFAMAGLLALCYLCHGLRRGRVE